MKIVIVGAGIGGLTAAALLARQGHAVRVLEQAAALGEVGAGVQLSANAVKVLFALGLRPQLEAAAVQPKGFEFRRHDSAELLHRIPLGAAHLQQHGAPYYQIHRGDLHAMLVQALHALAPDAIRLGARVSHLSESADSAVAHVDGHGPVAGDLLVGADGIRSTVRQFLVGVDHPSFTGQVAWRCTVPIERIAPALRTDLVSTIWCGPHKHAVMYYLRGAALLNFVGCVARPQEDESWNTRRPWSELDHDFHGWHPMVRAVVDAVDRDQCFRWALNNRAPLDRWSSDRVTLLGDAVHATLPYMAQGAAMAIEDAAVLARVVASPDWPLAQGLQRYGQLRGPRTARVVRESTEMGQLYQITDGAEMRQAFASRNIARSRNEWLYPYDPLTVPLDAPQGVD